MLFRRCQIMTYNLLLITSIVLFRSLSEFFLKTLGKIRMVGKADEVHHLGDGEFLLAEQHGSLLQTNGTDVVDRGGTGHFFHFAVNLFCTDS